MSDAARKMLDEAYLELSQETGASAPELRQAALELAGLEGRADFPTDRAEAEGIGRLAAGLRDGSLQRTRWTPQDVAAEHQRLARLHGEPYRDSPDALRFDQRKLDAHEDAPQPLTQPRTQRQPARLSAREAAEVDRLSAVALSMQQGPSRPAYGAAGNGPAPWDIGEASVTARGRQVSDQEILASVLNRHADSGLLALAATEAPAPPRSYCPQCGAHSRAQWAYCPDCGADLAAEHAPGMPGAREDEVPDARSLNSTDHAQPARGGVPHPRGLAQIMADNPDLFGKPGTRSGLAASGNYLGRPGGYPTPVPGSVR